MFKFNKSQSTPATPKEVDISTNKMVFSKDKVVDVTLSTIPTVATEQPVERVDKKPEVFNSTDTLDVQINNVVNQINSAFLAAKHINYNHRFVSTETFINTPSVKSAIRVLAASYVTGPHIPNRFSVPAMLRRLATLSQLFRIR